MTGLNSVLPINRHTLAVTLVFCLMLFRLAAQPLNVPAAGDPTAATDQAATNFTPLQLAAAAMETNFTAPTRMEQFDFVLATARYQSNTHDWGEAEKNYLKLLDSDVPEATQQTALFELAQMVRSENDLPRAQSIYTQYLQRWPGDLRTPEIFLREGQIFRDMGLNELALAKFYTVMTTALSLKDNELPYYKKMVLQAQVEIAETSYQMGKFKDAADYYSRLLTQNDPALDRAQIQFRLIRSLEAINRHDDAVNQAHDFLQRYPDSPEEPEVRYHLAQAYKAQNRPTEALQEVKTFLQEERNQTINDPAVWSYWQQRVGNEIGNELYQEGDYVKALQVYLALAQLDAAPAWQLPVRYQVGLTYEKLLQPQLAMEAYRDILTNGVPQLNTNLAPNLQSIKDMATWRLNFLEWNARAQPFVRQTETALASTNLSLNQP